jgi:HD-like signal output (HDOD) protein/CheY-like chemotaxis protein
MLRSMRQEWEMTFAESGAKGLELVSQQPFDVVVSDMLMPGMNGAQFLAEVRKIQPGTMRIVLSGHAERNLVLQAVGPAHQYLAKPCRPEVLKAAVMRGFSLRSTLQSESLRRFISELDRLPSDPAVFDELSLKLLDPQLSPEFVTSLIGQDPGMTVKILKIVNSAFFGFYGEISDVGRAISCLGLDTIKSLLFSTNAFSPCASADGARARLDDLWKHSLATARGSKAIAIAEKCGREVVDASFTAGLLHDLGKFVLVSHSGAQYSETVQTANEQKSELREVEARIFGASHDDAGAYLATLWGLPRPVTEAIAFHHCPDKSGCRHFSPLAAVHAANSFLREIPHPANGHASSPIHLNYLAGLGLSERMDDWRRLVHESLSPSLGI